MPAERHRTLTGLAEELRHVEWDLPPGVREARFHSIGLPGSRSFPVEEHFDSQRTLVISPFVREGALRRLLRPESGAKSVLVSRGEELDTIPPDALDGLDVYVLDPAASLAGSDEGAEDTGQAFLTHLHAKLFVAERGRLAHLFVGSANATGAGLGQNVEFLCELVAPVRTLGVETLVGDDAPFRRMLTPYAASEPEPVDKAVAAGRSLEDLLLDIAGGGPFRTVVTAEVDGWISRVTADTALPHFSEVMDVTIAPHNRQAETYPLRPGDPVDVALPARDLADLTPFLRLTVRQTVEGVVLERSTVVCSRLEGAPSERFDRDLCETDRHPREVPAVACPPHRLRLARRRRHCCGGRRVGELGGGRRAGCPGVARACAVREPRVHRPLANDRRAAASVGQWEGCTPRGLG